MPVRRRGCALNGPATLTQLTPPQPDTLPPLARPVREAELLPVLVVLAADDDTALREQALATLVLLTEDNASNAEFCRRTDVGLRRTLEAARRRLESEPAEDTVDERDSIAQLWAVSFA